jgi:hypothetical protein
MVDLVEIKGNMHMHTPYSDGENWHADIAQAAIAAGLDFIIVTDHNIWVDGLEGYYENENGRVLMLVGEEIHNVRRQPQASHLLVYGANTELAQHAADPQALIDAVRSAGGICFLAHPHENNCRLFEHGNLGWHDWEIEGFTGLEIWNYMSSFVNRLSDRLDNLPLQNGLLDKLTAVHTALNQEKFITFPEPATLALWDQLLAEGKTVTAVGNADAHGTPLSAGPIQRIIYPYEYLFRAVNTHLLLDAPLNGDMQSDKKRILQAIASGKSWIAYDLPHPTQGFRFSGHGVNKGYMGDRIQMDAGATLQVSAPTRCHIRLIRHGEVVAAIDNETNLTHIPIESGAYRVECHIPFRDQTRGWIYSNPIYLW